MRLRLTAIAAAVIGGVVVRLWCGDEFASAGDVLGARGAGEEAIVADAVLSPNTDIAKFSPTGKPEPTLGPAFGMGIKFAVPEAQRDLRPRGLTVVRRQR